MKTVLILYTLGTLVRSLADHESTVQSQSVYCIVYVYTVHTAMGSTKSAIMA